jgi:hypothetical protein
MKTKDQIDYDNEIEAQKRAIEERYEREQLRSKNGRHRPGKVRNAMSHLMPKKKKRKK